MISTGNNYWLATRTTNTGYNSENNTVPDSEEVRYETYGINYIRTDGVFASYTIFQVTGNSETNTNSSGSNYTYNCAFAQ